MMKQNLISRELPPTEQMHRSSSFLTKKQMSVLGVVNVTIALVNIKIAKVEVEVQTMLD